MLKYAASATNLRFKIKNETKASQDIIHFASSSRDDEATSRRQYDFVRQGAGNKVRIDEEVK